MLELILVAHHRPDQVRRVLSELDTTAGGFRYTVVNNAPDPAEMDAAIREFRTRRPLRVIRSESGHFTPSLNLALREAAAQSKLVFYVCSVHAKVHDVNWMRSCARWMRGRRRVGLAGSVTRSAGYGNRFDRSNLAFYKRRGRRFDYLEHVDRRWWSALTQREKYRLPHVQGGVWVIRSSMVERIGLPSENFFFSFVDVEYSFRAMSYGWELGDIPGVWADQERFKDSPPPGTLISHAKRNAD
jgi:hypothetical protein